MKHKFLNFIATIALVAILPGIWLTDVSLGEKIIWTSVYMIVVCLMGMYSDEPKKINDITCNLEKER